MITIRHGFVLLCALCTPAAGALAQDTIPSGLVTNEYERAVATHRLTAGNVRTLFAVERERLAVMKNVPDLGTRAAELGVRIDPSGLENSLVREVKVCEGLPEIAQILRRQHVSAREYVLTKQVALAAEMTDEALANEATRRELAESGILNHMMKAQPFRFWRAMDPALKAEAAEWKRIREEMGALERGK